MPRSFLVRLRSNLNKESEYSVKTTTAEMVKPFPTFGNYTLHTRTVSSQSSIESLLVNKVMIPEKLYQTSHTYSNTLGLEKIQLSYIGQTSSSYSWQMRNKSNCKHGAPDPIQHLNLHKPAVGLQRKETSQTRNDAKLPAELEEFFAIEELEIPTKTDNHTLPSTYQNSNAISKNLHTPLKDVLKVAKSNGGGTFTNFTLSSCKIALENEYMSSKCHPKEFASVSHLNKMEIEVSKRKNLHTQEQQINQISNKNDDERNEFQNFHTASTFVKNKSIKLSAGRNHVCQSCNKSFNRASNLRMHMRTHSDYKPYKCDYCGKGFHQKIDKRIHHYTHTGEKPHRCKKCGRGFKQLTHLNYHMRTHSDTHMYQCTYCGKGFNQKGNLQAHIYRHTGQRPFKCEICSKGFTLRSTLNTHLRTHAAKKPFNCEHCSKSFYQKNALKMHRIASHPMTDGKSMLSDTTKEQINT
ncbi:zinc finger protein 180-like isoform X2 [Xenia sp. Carnegie-2017]|nr:zinc finger protein 180-like isoform X2 [Xenia sp. Carnegie-2017]